MKCWNQTINSPCIEAYILQYLHQPMDQISKYTTFSRPIGLMHLLELLNLVIQGELFLISVDSKVKMRALSVSILSPEYPKDWVPLHHVAVRPQQDLWVVLGSGHLFQDIRLTMNLQLISLAVLR